MVNRELLHFPLQDIFGSYNTWLRLGPKSGLLHVTHIPDTTALTLQTSPPCVVQIPSTPGTKCWKRMSIARRQSLVFWQPFGILVCYRKTNKSASLLLKYGEDARKINKCHYEHRCDVQQLILLVTEIKTFMLNLRFKTGEPVVDLNFILSCRGVHRSLQWKSWHWQKFCNTLWTGST